MREESYCQLILHQKIGQIHQRDRSTETGRTRHLLIDCTVAVPTGHRLQHAAEEAPVAVRLVLRAAGHSVDDSGEHLQSDTKFK